MITKPFLVLASCTFCGCYHTSQQGTVDPGQINDEPKKARRVEKTFSVGQGNNRVSTSSGYAKTKTDTCLDKLNVFSFDQIEKSNKERLI